MVAEALFDPETHDEFGILLMEVSEFAKERMAEGFLVALERKAEYWLTNCIMYHGKAMEDTRVQRSVSRSLVELAVAWSAVAGYVELTEPAKRKPGDDRDDRDVPVDPGSVNGGGYL